MLTTDFNMSFNGTSKKEDGSTICTMSANTMTGLPKTEENSTSMGVNFYKNIPDISLYTENKETADTDFEEFQTKVLEMISNSN